MSHCFGCLVLLLRTVMLCHSNYHFMFTCLLTAKAFKINILKLHYSLQECFHSWNWVVGGWFQSGSCPQNSAKFSELFHWWLFSSTFFLNLISFSTTLIGYWTSYKDFLVFCLYSPIHFISVCFCSAFWEISSNFSIKSCCFFFPVFF